ncbi:LrgB family protein [Aureimonas populi]|uniref:LrgB family protein n=1 Tax=Aureimonas populi TaxID=1701758 RepID=A0ABW5CJ51_9HYPH|nr:LrgB family protein [Aureimonas populi]
MIRDTVPDIWVYLATTPLFALLLTLVAYQIGMALHVRSGFMAIVNPVLLAILIVVGVLLLTDTGYQTYFDGAQFVHFLLGPATVALAVPLYRQFERIRKSWKAILASLVAGSLTSILTAVGIARLFSAPGDIVTALAPKAATTPVAMAITEALGGPPSLSAVFVLMTGMLGAMLGPALLSLLRIDDPASRGLALGTASHGIGTARAFQESEVTGAFSGLAMGLNAIATALLLPLLWYWLA